MRRLGWLSGFLLLIVVLAAGGFAAVVYLPQFNAQRQDFASSVLSANFGRDVAVDGPVSVSLGSTVEVTIEDMRVASVFSSSASEPERIDHGAFSFPLASLSRGSPNITGLELSGVNLEFVSSGQEADEAESRRGALAVFPTRFLKHPSSGNLALNDVELRFVNAEAGFDEKISIDTLRSSEDGASRAIAIEAKGTVNGLPIALDADFENPRRVGTGRPLDFSIDLALPGTTNRLSGTLDVGEPVAIVDGMMDVDVRSLGDVLDALQLRRVTEGTGTLTAKLSGPLDALVVQDIEGATDSEQGNSYGIKGRVDFLGTDSKLDLTISGTLPRESDLASATALLTDARVTGFEGRVSGSFDAMQVDRFLITTNALNVKFRNIGPISVQRIAKDEEGNLGIRGIHVLDGPTGSPWLDLEGDVDNALKLRGIRFAGKFDLPTTDILFLEGGEESKALGRVAGELAMSDEDGTFGLDAFAGSVRDSDLLDLKLELVKEGTGEPGKAGFDTELNIPDFKAFAAALGVESRASGGLEFTGHLSVADDVATFDGRIVADETAIDGHLSAKREDGVPRIAGSIESESLTFTDLRDLWDVKQIRRKKNVDYVTFNDNLLEDLEADVEVAASEIVEAGEAAGDFSGRMIYAQRKVRLDPLAMTYLGGTVEAAATIDLAGKTPTLAATGTVNRIPLQSLLAQFRAPPIATGSLNAKFDVSGVASQDQFAKTASGNATLSLWGGTIGTNLIDLTGMDYVSWAFTQKDDDSTQIVCAVLPLALKNGRGSTSAMVVETENVQLVGQGAVDLAGKTLDLQFQPIPKNENTAGVATPFSVSGSFLKPDINVDQQAVNKRIGAEVMAMPMKFFNNLMGGNDEADTESDNRPCVVRKAEKQETQEQQHEEQPQQEQQEQQPRKSLLPLLPVLPLQTQQPNQTQQTQQQQQIQEQQSGR